MENTISITVLWANLEHVFLTFKVLQHLNSCILSKSENFILILKASLGSTICLLIVSERCHFEFQNVAKYQKLYLGKSGKCHVDFQSFTTFSKSLVIVSGKWYFDFQSLANTQKLYLSKFERCHFDFQCFARFNNMSLDRFWKMSFWFLKCRKNSKSVSCENLENVTLIFKVSQGPTICLLIVPGTCYFDFRSFFNTQKLYLQPIRKMPFWFSKFHKVQQYVSWSFLDSVSLIFEVSQNFKSCILIKFGKCHFVFKVS